MRKYQIVETDNHEGDFPDEKFLNLPYLSQNNAAIIAQAINDCLCKDDYAARFGR